MLAALLVIGSLATQATAASLPFWKREGGVTTYQGPGTPIRNLSPSSDATTSARVKRDATYSRIYDADQAQQLLGADSIVDCPPNGLTQWDHALSASTLFIDSLGGQSIAIQPGLCFHQEYRDTLAQICNRGATEASVSLEQAQVAFDVLEETCTSRSSSGTIQTASGLQYALFAKVGVGRSPTRKRNLGEFNKRCLSTDTQEVTGCEDSVCNPAITLNESGDCPYFNDLNTDGCTSYCEIKAAKYYGVASVYDDTRFCAGNDCYLEEGESFTVEKSLSVNFGIEGAGPLESVLNTGISFGIAISETTSLTQGFNFGEGKCGWWYKAPVMLHTCGTKTEYSPNFGSETIVVCLKDAPFKSSTPNACAEIQATAMNSDSADVIVIPRWYNCGDRKELPDSENSPSWQSTYGGQNDEVRTC